MKRARKIIPVILLMLFITGCTKTAESQPTQLGRLLLHQDQIKTIEVIAGATEEKTVTLSKSADYITDLLTKTKKIPVNKLSKSEDIKFMTKKRMLDESRLCVCFCGKDNSFDSLQGEFLIWPDGKIYVVDTLSMKGNQRTIAYLSKSKYPELYEWLADQAQKQ